MIERIGRHFAVLKAALPNPAVDGRGVVLIAVLWICALIMWFALQISAEVRFQGEERIQSIRKSQALYLATGGCYEALARMGQPPPLDVDEQPERNWQPDGKPRLVQYDTGRAVVIIEPEDRKVSVNRVGRPQLREVLERAGADEVTADRLTDLIMDFIDQDDTPRLNGGEKDYYRSLGLNYVPFNGPLTSLDQLLLIPGMTQKLFYGYGGSGAGSLLTSELGDIYKDFLIPGKNSLFSMLTIYGTNVRLISSEDEESASRQLSWRMGGIYRVLSFGLSANGPPPVGIWLTVRFSPQEKSSYKVLSRKVL